MPTSPQRFVVTGAAGFIGSNLVLALNGRGHDDLLLVDRLDDANRKNLVGLKYREFMDKDEFRARILANRLDGVTTVFHLGACSSTTESNEDYLMDNNFLYTRQLCEWCLRTHSRFVYASSAACYGDGSHSYSDDDDVTPRLEPLNLYGQSKHRFDLWAIENRLLGHIAGLRYFNVYGPREDHKGDMRSVVNKAYAQVLKTGELTLFKSYRPDYQDGEQDRDFVYVDDAVKVTLFFHDHTIISGIFNCGTARARTWLDLAHALFAAMGRKPEIRFVDMPETLRDKYQYHTLSDNSKLRLAGYGDQFIPLEQGVADYVRNYLAKG